MTDNAALKTAYLAAKTAYEQWGTRQDRATYLAARDAFFAAEKVRLGFGTNG